MIRLYMDENVHGDITRGLRRAGVDVLTVQEDGRASLPDPLVLDRANDLGRVLFSQDTDLLAEASLRQATGQSFAGVIYARQKAVPIGRCIADLLTMADAGSNVDSRDCVWFLLL